MGQHAEDGQRAGGESVGEFPMVEGSLRRGGLVGLENSMENRLEWPLKANDKEFGH